MAEPTGPPPPGEPHWNGGRILFDVADGLERVACTISVGALQDMSGQRRFKPADLLASFAGVRGRIEAIALGKLRSRPAGVTGLIHVWSDDIDDARDARG